MVETLKKTSRENCVGASALLHTTNPLKKKLDKKSSISMTKRTMTDNNNNNNNRKHLHQTHTEAMNR
jgi:hypothetical protein